MWQGQTWVTRKETLLLLVCWLVAHMGPWLTKPTQVPWTGNQPICQVVYISVFCLYILSWDRQKYNYYLWDLICPDVLKKVKWLRRCTLTIFFKVIYLHSVDHLSSGGLNLLPNFQKRRPGNMSIFRRRLLEKRAWLFWAGGGMDRSCSIKNKLRSEILNTKKIQTKMFICHN